MNVRNSVNLKVSVKVKVKVKAAISGAKLLNRCCFKGLNCCYRKTTTR